MTVKEEYTLDGLGCANCAAKMESQIKALSGVNQVSVNFGTSTLAIEADSDDIEKIITEARKIINKIEPGVVVQERKQTKNPKKVYLLMGLDCANCAGKIESAVNGLPDVASASLDFVSRKLTVEAPTSLRLHELEEEIKRIVNKYEPDVVVSREELHEIVPSQSEKKQGEKLELIRLGMGALIYLAAVLFTFSPAVEVALYGISYILIGGEVVLKAVRNITRGQVFDENFLMTIATAGAFAIKEYPEAVAVMLFYQIGELFQDFAVNRSRRSIQALLDIRPDYANLKKGDEVIQVNPEKVAIGDVILIKPGERVPLDGKIIDGKSMMDTSALTGESVPRDVKTGDEILSGFINTSGAISVEVSKEFGESTVAKILDLVQNASSKKAPTENFITKFARYYTPVVVIIAAALAIIPPLIIPGALFSDWLYRALIFLVISCPCALVVSIPLGFFGGIGGASRSGVLVKGSNYLEALNNVDSVIFDKTGTLTKGVFKVTSLVPTQSFNQEQLLEAAALAEAYSTHPIAKSILESYGKVISKERIDSYEEVAGHGIKVEVEGKTILAGNRLLMDKAGITSGDQEISGTVVHVAIDNQYTGHLLISDEIKEDSPRAIKELKDMGIKKLVMLTGDSKAVAAQVAGNLKLDEFFAELLPQDKVARIEEIYAAKGKGNLVFVGDGINDAPVLARADVGVAMGGLGSDAAIEAADVVIMTDEPSKLATAIRIAKKTRSIVWQNIILALVVKGIVLAMGAGGIATMWEAVFADVGVAVIAILNAMQVLRTRFG
ncbi:MAG: heavy metal translocating P-type ATPase [Dehalobacterium sp.]